MICELKAGLGEEVCGQGGGEILRTLILQDDPVVLNQESVLEWNQVFCWTRSIHLYFFPSCETGLYYASRVKMWNLDCKPSDSYPQINFLLSRSQTQASLTRDAAFTSRVQ